MSCFEEGHHVRVRLPFSEEHSLWQCTSTTNGHSDAQKAKTFHKERNSGVSQALWKISKSEFSVIKKRMSSSFPKWTNWEYYLIRKPAGEKSLWLHSPLWGNTAMFRFSFCIWKFHRIYHHHLKVYETYWWHLMKHHYLTSWDWEHAAIYLTPFMIHQCLFHPFSAIYSKWRVARQHHRWLPSQSQGTHQSIIH